MCLIFDAQKAARNVHKSLPQGTASRLDRNKSGDAVAVGLAKLTRYISWVIGHLLLELNVALGKPMDELSRPD